MVHRDIKIPLLPAATDRNVMIHRQSRREDLLIPIGPIGVGPDYLIEGTELCRVCIFRDQIVGVVIHLTLHTPGWHQIVWKNRSRATAVLRIGPGIASGDLNCSPTQLSHLLGIKEVPDITPVRYVISGIAVVIDLNSPFATLCCDNYHSIGSTSSINRCGSGILQYWHRLNILRI